jgi:hypothetical protein
VVGPGRFGLGPVEVVGFQPEALVPEPGVTPGMFV